MLVLSSETSNQDIISGDDLQPRDGARVRRRRNLYVFV